MARNENEILLDDFFKSVYSYLNYGDFTKALGELKDFIEILPSEFIEDPNFDYFYFNNPLEEELFKKYFKTNKQLRIIPFGQEYPRVFYLYGIALMILSKFKQAKAAFKKALSYNPVSCEILSTLSRLHDITSNLASLKETSLKILKYSYDPLEIASAYRDLAYFYYENRKCAIAKALYETSLEYEKHPRAQIYLQLIDDYTSVGEVDVKQLLNDENIPVGVNEDILNLLMSLARKFENNQALYFYGVYYNLTHDEEILNKINGE